MDKLQGSTVPCLLLLASLLTAATADAHPYDSPLEFREHRTEDGRKIYSNIPKKCFSHGRLTCYRLHPIFPSTKTPVSPPASAVTEN